MLEHDKEFNNLKIHTQYSICEGAIKIDDLAAHCKANKIKALGLADSYNLCGALEFAEKISKAGTQPIIGTQINISGQNSQKIVSIRCFPMRFIRRKIFLFRVFKNSKSKFRNSI